MEVSEEENAGTNDINEPEETYGTQPFTIDDLKAHWEVFTIRKKEEGRDSEYAVLKQEYALSENTITLKLTNAVKLNILDKFRSDLVTYLKQKLDNRNIELVTELIEEEHVKVPYTNKEKFEYLAEKKPILNKLRNRLGLDPDF